MLHVIVLGAAAGGGVPQWNCGCAVCEAARHDAGAWRSGQASIAFSADGAHWFLVNASPDVRQQINDTPALHPKALRHTPIAGIILTNGEVDAVAGLLSLREGAPFTLYAHPDILDLLAMNSIFNVLDKVRVPRQAVATGETFRPTLPDGSPSGLVVETFPVPGKPAWYLEADGSVPEGSEGDTIGLEVSLANGDARFLFVPACAAMTPELAERIDGAPLLFFDGTLWRDDEMIRAGLSQKSGARMGHLSMSGSDGAMASLAEVRAGRKLFLHVNNSNPALLRDSEQRRAVEAGGWEIAEAGMEIAL